VHRGFVPCSRPLVVRLQVVASGRVDRWLSEASEDLGGTFGQTLRHVIRPLTAPGMFAGSLFVFVMALGSSVEVQFLGGAAASMIAIMIQDVIRVLNFPLAFAISTSVVLFLILLLIVGSRFLGLARLS